MPIPNGSLLNQFQNECAYLVTMNAQTVAKTHGGAQRSKVTVSLNPIVLLRVGKKALKLREITMDDSASASHHTFQSVNAKKNPSI